MCVVTCLGKHLIVRAVGLDLQLHEIFFFMKENKLTRQKVFAQLHIILFFRRRTTARSSSNKIKDAPFKCHVSTFIWVGSHQQRKKCVGDILQPFWHTKTKLQEIGHLATKLLSLVLVQHWFLHQRARVWLRINWELPLRWNSFVNMRSEALALGVKDKNLR